MTRGELLLFVRQRRDVVGSQIDHYFARVPGLVRYTDHIVGLAPLDRAVMTRMFMSEPCVVALLRGRRHRSTSFRELWLLPDEDPVMSQEEQAALLRASQEWTEVEASMILGEVFFSERRNK